MKFINSLILICVLASFATAEEFTYKGTWVTVKNKKLDGTMKATIKPAGGGVWNARFFGVWQGVAFDYTVPFNEGAAGGKATIDGARYEWKGTITPEKFNGTFTGDRYEGDFQLDRVP